MARTGGIDPGRRRFAVLDRDGTVIVEKHYLSDPGQVELIPGAAKGLAQFRDMDLGLIVITNQSGVGRGFFDHNQVGAINSRMSALLEAEGVHLDGIFYCPHTPDDGCRCRKPRTALLELAAEELHFAPGSCFVIGDKASDIELGHNVGATTFLVATGYGTEVAGDGSAHPTYSVRGLEEVAQVIQGLLEPVRRG